MSLALKVVKEAALLRFRAKVSHLILHVTNICNFRCNHCFVYFEHKPTDLSLDEIKSIAAQFDDLIWLNLGGGEPFIRPDLADIVNLFKAKEISIPTNGWFTDKIVNTLEKIRAQSGLERILLCISMDGLEATHDEIRDQKGSFQTLLKTYREVRARFPELRVKINTVLHKRNLEEILPLMSYVKEHLNPSFHSIMFLRGSPLNDAYGLPSIEVLKPLEDEIFQIQQDYMYGRKGILSSVHRHYQTIKREIATQIVVQKRQVIPCLAGEANLVVYANGDVAPCELLPTVGSLRKESLKDIITGEPWQNAVDRIQNKQCHCTHDCNMMENVLFNFRLYPRLLTGKL